MQQIHHNSAYVQAVLNTMLDGLITIDSKGTIKGFNAAAVRIFKYKPEEVIGQNIKILMPDPYHSDHDDYLRNYIETGEKKVIGIGREVSGKRKNGAIFPIELGINEMILDDERMFVGTIRDITERKQAENEIIRSNAELERFAYVASHDLQEPLRMVKNFTELLKKKYADVLDEQGNEYIDFASNAAFRMQQLVSDLLEYARIGQDNGSFEATDTELIIQMAKENLSETISSAKAIVDHPETLPKIHANPIRLLSVFQNLISNSLKYREKNKQPKISISYKIKGDMCEFCVSDNGIGMRPEYCQKIFDPFKRLHAKDEYTGTGMGLAICRRIIEGLGGDIWAVSELGQGANFYFTLPLYVTDTKSDYGESDE